MCLSFEYLVGDVRDVLAEMEAGSINTCVTSPPYWGLRDYGTGDKQLGLEATPEEYVANMVDVFRGVRRVLRDDGTLWLNLGDSYNGSQQTGGTNSISGHGASQPHGGILKDAPGLKPKDLVGIPWRVAFALQADGWYLRQDIIWHKPNPMPESVTDRCTKSHEYIFLLSKSKQYYYDHEAIKEDSVDPESHKGRRKRNADKFVGERFSETRSGFLKLDGQKYPEKNKRSVWTVTTKPYKGAHFAVFPEDLIKPCILAGAPKNGVVLDPFCGSGTSLWVSRNLGRSAVGIDINEEYREMALKRAMLDVPTIESFIKEHVKLTGDE